MNSKSSEIDRNDETALRDIRRKGAEAGVTDKSGPFFPIFFARDGSALPLMGRYLEAAAFLIAAGPSFAEIDTTILRSVWTMTLNNAVATYRGNANCIVDDPSRFSLSMWLDPTIQKFVPLAAFAKPLWDNRLLSAKGKTEQQWCPTQIRPADCPNVIGYLRNERFNAARFLYEDTINWGCHARFGGARSVMLPALRILFLLGFRRIYLLGVDFEMTPRKKYHFSEDRPPGAIRNNMRTYAKLQAWLAALQPYFLKEGFIVRNCNPASKMTAFPFIPLDEAVAEATHALGNYSAERTFGMYKPICDKLEALETRPVENCGRELIAP